MNFSINKFKKHAKEIFESVPDLYLILDKNLDIVGASDSYLQAICTERDKIVGSCIFELFINESNEEHPPLISELRNSLRRVLANKKSDAMIMQKFHILSDKGRSIRYWNLLNSPVLDDEGEVIFIIHRIVDMTELIKKKKITHATQAEIYSYIHNIEETNIKLYKQEAIRTALIEAIPDAILIVNREGIITYVNQRLEFLFGYAQEELIGQKMELLIPEPSRNKHAVHRENYFRNPKIRPMGMGMDLWALQKNGTIFSVEISLSPLNTFEGDFAIAIIRDVTQKTLQTKKFKQNEEELQISNKNLEQDRSNLLQMNNKIILITEFSEVLISCTNEDEIIQAIKSYIGEIFGFCKGALYLFDSFHNEFELKTFWGDSKNTFKLKFSSQECWGVRQSSFHQKSTSHPGIQCAHLSNYQSELSYVCAPFSAHNEVYGLISLEVENPTYQSLKVNTLLDIICKTIAIAMANVRLQELLKNQSLQDTLTGLYNRRFLDDYIMKQIFHAEREHLEIGIILFDIDNFKQINDKLGHEVGDKILHELGHLLIKLVRAEDVFCRYGGEEFICILTNSSLKLTTSRGEEIRQAVSDLFPGPIPPKITISVGVSIYPADGTTPSELIIAADKAMYLAKTRGKNQLVAFKDINKD